MDVETFEVQNIFSGIPPKKNLQRILSTIHCFSCVTLQLTKGQISEFDNFCLLKEP